MYEPTVTRSLGTDGSWPDRSGATGRPDVHTDGARPDAATAVHAPPHAAAGPAPADTTHRPGSSGSNDVAFPRSYARFEMIKDTQRLSIKIVDAVTDEVIRVIPAEEVDRIA